MRVYYNFESIRVLIVVNVVAFILLSPWVVATLLGKTPPIWFILVFSLLITLGLYVMFVRSKKKRVFEEFRNNAFISDEGIVFDEPVDVEIGYCYVYKKYRVFEGSKTIGLNTTVKVRYLTRINRNEPVVSFKAVKRLKGVTQIPMPYDEFFVDLAYPTYQTMFKIPATLPSRSLRFAGVERITRCYAPAIRVTSGRYKNLFIILFGNDFDIVVSHENENVKLMRNGILLRNNYDRHCNLTIMSARTGEVVEYTMPPDNSVLIEFLPNEPVVVVDYYVGKSYYYLRKVLLNAFPRSPFLGVGEYHVFMECDGRVSSLKLVVRKKSNG